MPNIDINIKKGNSLVSRYDLYNEIEIPNIKEAIRQYKETVREYKAGQFASKEAIRRAIEELKEKFKLFLKASWKETKALKEMLSDYVKNYGLESLNDDLLLKAIEYRFVQHGVLPGMEEASEEKEKRRRKALEKIEEIYKRIEEIESGKIYENAFEWRFEFP